jgi:ABC-2 type transport system permease protein
MNRRTLLVARADLRRAVRDRLLVGMFVLLAVLTFPSYTGLGDVYTFEEAILLTPFDFMKFAVIPAVAAGYAAVAGSRESGTIRHLLAVGATRREVVVGTLLSRTVVVAVPLACLLAVLGALFVDAYSPAVLPVYAVVGAVVVAYGVAWTGVTVGLSAALGSRYRALAAAFCCFLAFSPTLGLWRVVVRPLIALTVTGSAATATDAYAAVGTAAAPAWTAYTERLNPISAFFWVGKWIAAHLAGVTETPATAPTAFGAAVVVALGVVPVAVGVRRFERADLGGTAGRSLGVRLREAVPDVTGGRLRAAAPAVRSGPSFPSGPVATVFRRDLRTTLQNRLLWGVAVVFLVVLVPRLWTAIDPTNVTGPVDDLTDLAGQGFGLFVPVLATTAAYRAVAGERETGTVRFLLSLPASRRDVLVGKFAARLTAVGVVLVPFLALDVAFVGVRLGPGYVVGGVVGTAWVLVYALAWTGVVVGWSAATGSRYRVLVGVFGTFLAFSGVVGLWERIVLPLIGLVATGTFEAPRRGSLWSDSVAEWTLYARRLNPLGSYTATDDWLLSLVGYPTGATDPVLGLFGVAVLVAFGGLPVAIGLWRFNRATLG